jgi:hypothetical protein
VRCVQRAITINVQSELFGTGEFAKVMRYLLAPQYFFNHRQQCDAPHISYINHACRHYTVPLKESSLPPIQLGALTTVMQCMDEQSKVSSTTYSFGSLFAGLL